MTRVHVEEEKLFTERNFPLLIWVVKREGPGLLDAGDHWNIDPHPFMTLSRAFPLAAPKPELSRGLC